jgi:hypothetical protein
METIIEKVIRSTIYLKESLWKKFRIYCIEKETNCSAEVSKMIIKLLEENKREK